MTGFLWVVGIYSIVAVPLDVLVGYDAPHIRGHLLTAAIASLWAWVRPQLRSQDESVDA